jgi:transposase
MDAPASKTPPSTPQKAEKKNGPKGPKTSRKEWDTPTRKDVLDLFHYKNKSKGEISTKTGIPRTTVNDIIARGEEDKTILRTARPQRGNYYKISREKVLEIERDMDGSWGRSSMTSQELIDYYDLNCWPQTLLNSFRREGIGHFWAAQDKFLTQKNKDERKEYAHEQYEIKKRRLPY